MNITKYKNDKNLFLNRLKERLSDFNQRERIVINMPFGCNLNRLEIYCSETAPNENTGFFGEKFRGIVTLQTFTDYTNKAANKTSYSYETELLKYLPELVNKIFIVAFNEQANIHASKTI